jgi:hypothetical protein
LPLRNPLGIVLWDDFLGVSEYRSHESNWIPTLGKEPYVWLRRYGPEEPFWNKTFKMPDGELTK